MPSFYNVIVVSEVGLKKLKIMYLARQVNLRSRRPSRLDRPQMQFSLKNNSNKIYK